MTVESVTIRLNRLENLCECLEISVFAVLENTFWLVLKLGIKFYFRLCHKIYRLLIFAQLSVPQVCMVAHFLVFLSESFGFWLHRWVLSQHSLSQNNGTNCGQNKRGKWLIIQSIGPILIIDLLSLCLWVYVCVLLLAIAGKERSVHSRSTKLSEFKAKTRPN